MNSERIGFSPPGARATRQRLNWWWIPVAMVAIVGVLLCAVHVAGPVLPLSGVLEPWAAIAVAITVQAMPFLALGVIVSGIISAFVTDEVLHRLSPRSSYLAVPVAAGAGLFLPGCECGSVPVSQSLIRRGVAPAVALTFMLAAPAINPVVLVSTAVAFAGNPQMVIARLIASAGAAILVGWAWVAWRGEAHMPAVELHAHRHGRRWEAFRDSAVSDLTNAGGFLAAGAMIAALVKVVVPTDWFETLDRYPWVAVLSMAALAVVLSLCSEADAFVAASFTQVSPVAQLVFLVVGPMVDIKLIAMQLGAWGRRFVLRFVPLALVSAMTAAIIVGVAFFGAL